ncbi:MAG TPA: ribonuclease R [Ignavibacteria bacterium]|nr:ribonuclease R [Ignavibacteria bacterium]
MEISAADKITSFLKKHPKDVFKLNTIIKNTGLTHLKKSAIKGELKNLLTDGTIIRDGKLFKIASTGEEPAPKETSNKKTKISRKTKNELTSKDIRQNERRKRGREKANKRIKDYERAEQRQENLKTQLSENLNAFKTVTGRYEYGRKHGVVFADWKLSRKEIFISHKDNYDAQTGDKVVCEVLNPEDIIYESNELYGNIIEVLGRSGDMDAETMSVIRKYKLIKEFPSDIEKQVKKTEFKEDLEGRIDLRDEDIFTIDPADAKDFDDAVSIKKKENGEFEIGVHIADVSHYVKENTPIDKEALKRGTSVYLVDQVIPMLPEKLSNDICSLRTDVERLTFSIFITLNKSYKLKKFEITKSIINSKRRFSYEEAQEIIKTGKGDYAEELKLMMSVAKKLTALRLKEGGLDFETKEVKFVTDKKGNVKEIKLKERLDSMRLIEEFMLLANKCATLYVTRRAKEEKRHLPFVYRVHDFPDAEKLNNLSEFVKQFGYDVKIQFPNPDKNQLKKLLDAIKGKPEEYVINNLLIRSMAKAVYTPINIGHYGLGFDDYTHFTSPIRRYPDLQVHRILYDYLTNEKNLDRRINHYKLILPIVCKQSTDMEINAVNAEREVIKLKQIQYISKHIGDEFDGLISGIVERGMFIELNDILVEGMIRFKDIADDYYEFDEKKHAAIGRRRGRIFRAGDIIRVRVIRANMESKKIDFELA